MPLRPLDRTDGYLPIEDHGLIGDGVTCALVGRDGSVPWLCLPNFDSRPFLAGILDTARGGSFDITPVGLRESAQRYLPDTGILVTEMQGDGGRLELTDCLTLRSGADLGAAVEPVAEEAIGTDAPIDNNVNAEGDVLAAAAEGERQLDA